MNAHEQVTDILQRIDGGDEFAAKDLFPLVYEELRRLAKWRLSSENAGLTLQPTDLVNEAFIRLVGANQDLRYKSRRGFMCAAAEAMRHILVDAARRKLTQKRGDGIAREHVDVDGIAISQADDVLDIHLALTALQEHDSQVAELVRLHYFGGYTLAEIAQILNLSRSTVNRWWIYAKAWMKSYLRDR